jgi:hypothetical protein
MLVTCYYDLYNTPEAFMKYVYLFCDLAGSGIPIMVFTDPSLVTKFRIFPPWVRVIGIPLESFELYKLAMSYNRDLPSQRSSQKDTKEYLSLMNTKIEFIKKASELTDDKTFIWIDFGILKIMNNIHIVLDYLKYINSKTFNDIIIPGCWQFGATFSVDRVNWRFCGGFVVFPRQHIDTFYNHSKNVLTDFCTLPQYKLTWETNIWNIIEFCTNRKNIVWYLADHNDSIILNIKNIINP